MLLGFISLLLSVSQGLISKICIPESVANSMHPCSKKEENDQDHDDDDTPTQNRRLLSSISSSGQRFRRVLALAETSTCSEVIFSILDIFLDYWFCCTCIINLTRWIYRGKFHLYRRMDCISSTSLYSSWRYRMSCTAFPPWHWVDSRWFIPILFYLQCIVVSTSLPDFLCNFSDEGMEEMGKRNKDYRVPIFQRSVWLSTWTDTKVLIRYMFPFLSVQFRSFQFLFVFFYIDPERFRFARDTTFGRRHLKMWSKTPLLIWIVSISTTSCFLFWELQLKIDESSRRLKVHNAFNIPI